MKLQSNPLMVGEPNVGPYQGLFLRGCRHRKKRSSAVVCQLRRRELGSLVSTASCEARLLVASVSHFLPALIGCSKFEAFCPAGVSVAGWKEPGPYSRLGGGVGREETGERGEG